MRDLILAAGGITFTIALVPMLFAAAKPPLLTSIPTWFWLTAFAGVYASLGLWLATATTFTSAVLWGILAGQRIHRRTRA